MQYISLLHQTKTIMWKALVFLIVFMRRPIGEYTSLELFYLDNHHVLFIKSRLIALVPY